MKKLSKIGLALLVIWGAVGIVGFIWGMISKEFANPLVPLVFILIMIFAFLRIYSSI